MVKVPSWTWSDSIFQDYGFIDPELSAAWDEDHGLKPKRAQTAIASVKQIKTFIVDLSNSIIFLGQPNAAMEGSQSRNGVRWFVVAWGTRIVCMRRVFFSRSPLSLHRLLRRLLTAILSSMRKCSHIWAVEHSLCIRQSLTLWVGYARSGAMTFVSLKSLSLHIQLGHRPGVTCVNPKRLSRDDFVQVTLDCNGIHEVGLNYCGCKGAKISEVLHRFSESPDPVTATRMNPKLAATIHMMIFFCSSPNVQAASSPIHLRCTDIVGSNPAASGYVSSL